MQFYSVCLISLLYKTSEAIYNFRCPVQAHWKHRSEATCDSWDKYFCVYDQNKNNFTEFCRDKPDFEAPGRKLTISGSIQGVDCDNDFYQPNKFWSSGNSRCAFKKSICSDEGQLLFNNGTTQVDRLCRCDYTRGYDFIVRPKHECYCIPSEEDCSCYDKICSVKEILSPDYECIDMKTWEPNSNCDSIDILGLPKDIKVSSTVAPWFETYVPVKSDTAKYRKEARLVLLLLVLSPSIITLIIWILTSQYFQFKLKQYLTDIETVPRKNVEEEIAFVIANEKSSLEKQIHANDFEKEKLKDEIRKLKDNKGKVSHHVLELQKEILQHWSNVLNKFVLTKAAQFLYQYIRTENVIVIIGPTGTGKSAYAYHIAFRLKNEHDYTIVPARHPSDIIQYYVPRKKQVFVIDDFIGKYAMDETHAVLWEKEGPYIHKILSNNDQTKVILTCRRSIWHPEKNESFEFSALVCDLHTKELRLTLSEKRQIFEAYRCDAAPLNDEILMMFTFFPSLCSIFSSQKVGNIESFFTMPVQFIEKEINNYKNKSQVCYMSLAVLAIEQKIAKKSFFDNAEHEELIQHLFRESGFQTLPSQTLIVNHLEALTGTFVKIGNGCYKFINEIMQNIVLYCIAKTLLISVLKFCKSDVFKNQVRLTCVREEQTVLPIKVRSEHEEAYFARLSRELGKRHYSEVFGNNQNAFQIFRKKWLDHLNKTRKKFHLKPSSDGSTVLHVVSSLGYADYVSYFIEIDRRIVYQADANGNTPLHLASLNGHLDTVKCLVENSRNIHILNNDKVSPFVYACENNEIQVVKYLINLEGDLVQINETYMTREHKNVLHIACSKGLTQIVNILLYHHAAVDIQDKNGLTPLHLSCLTGQYDAARLLINARANVNIMDISRITPVYLACTGNYKNIVELLIEYKADINQSTLTGSTPLHAACEQNSIEIADILIENLSSVNVKEKTVESPLHIACRQGNARMVNLLIDHSASVNSKTKDKLTPLHVACSNGHQHVVDILLKKNANYKQRNKNGWTALLFSCANGNNDIVKMLLNLENNVNISSSDGITPLMLACKGNHINVVETLLVSNADVNQCNDLKSSPLEYACYAGNIDIVNLLLEHGASTNLANKNGITPLHVACMFNHSQVVDVLIEKKAEINPVDILGETPLYKACFNGNIEIVTILLNKGAEINIAEYSGKFPVAIAKGKGFNSIVELLDNANTV